MLSLAALLPELPVAPSEPTPPALQQRLQPDFTTLPMFDRIGYRQYLLSGRICKKAYFLRQKKLFDYRHFAHDVVDYCQALSYYRMQHMAYEEEVRRRTTPDKVERCRKKALKMLLKNAKKPVFTEGAKQRKRGVSERHFQELLEKKFKGKIFGDLVFMGENNMFYPDYVYWDKRLNLVIDIEVDEPYVSFSGRPIHYIDPQRGSVDARRDKQIIGLQWMVLRFAERQIFEQPTECLRYVEELVAQIATKLTFDFDNIGIVKKIEKWGKEDALRMVQEYYRASYMPQELQVYIKARHASKKYTAGLA
jgi:hypothetical protein